MHFTAAQLKHLEKRLHDERARLVDQLSAFEREESSGDSQSLAGDISKFPTHAADLGTDVVAEEVETSIASRASAEIAEINAALERLASSPATFGLDEETGHPIPYARLDLIPYARISVHREV
jgi:DnaK suppressor protein